MWDKGEIHFLVKDIINTHFIPSHVLYILKHEDLLEWEEKKIAHAMSCSFKTKMKL